MACLSPTSCFAFFPPETEIGGRTERHALGPTLFESRVVSFGLVVLFSGLLAGSGGIGLGSGPTS